MLVRTNIVNDEPQVAGALSIYSTGSVVTEYRPLVQAVVRIHTSIPEKTNFEPSIYAFPQLALLKNSSRWIGVFYCEL